ncbi:DUF4870 domain-containing protein [Radiobacillus sp. PE A8.2]|uniref:DUF4870 domain-containing protein n=1 Tax=Radiobacillus sp. PE A8.2 TaxID=3380349 RepID=UPI0038906397
MTEQENTATKEDKVTNDVEENKVIGILAYFIFFLPLIVAKGSKFAMYHANQGLLLFLSAVIINILGGAIPILGWFIIWPLGNIFLLYLLIMGIVNSSKGEAKQLPFIGKYNIIK